MKGVHGLRFDGALIYRGHCIRDLMIRHIILHGDLRMQQQFSIVAENKPKDYLYLW